MTNASKIAKTDQNLDQANSSISQLDAKKSDKTEVKAINIRLDGFANIEHIDSLKNHFLPRIEKFSEEIDKFMSDNRAMRECIIKFDQDISIKANKSDFPLFKSKLDQEYVNFDNYLKLDKRYDTFLDLYNREKDMRDIEFLEFKNQKSDHFDD